MKNLINVSAAFLIKDKKVLVVQKNEKSAHPLKWEFPGGKLIGDEKFDEALIREMKEELGLKVKAVQELGSIEYDTENDVTIIMFIIAESDAADIKLFVHKDYKFCSYDELKSLDMLIPDKMFVEQYEEEIKKFIS
ncbi:MAG: NUDIX domain-containing protein [Spirochaetes bacterium]|nr:NUDIX domain-containing protein [Spirochaetota bacterium]